MSKKVSELTKELDISLQELKDYAVKMGIEVGGASSSIEDVDAERLTSTINLMKGNSGAGADGASKPKIKAVPVVPKATPVAKAPVGKPVIPKKAVVPKEEEKHEDDAAAQENDSEIKSEEISDASE